MNLIVFRVLLPAVASAIYEKDGAEGNFRYAHARIREYSESMMFYKADATEKANVETIFAQLISKTKSLITSKILPQGINICQAIAHTQSSICCDYDVWTICWFYDGQCLCDLD